MEKRKTSGILIVAAVALAIYFVIGFVQTVLAVASVPDGIVVSPYAVSRADYGAVKCELSVPAATDDVGKGKLSFKLFGLLPIKTIDIICAKDRQVRIGGFPVGLTLKLDGVLVDEVSTVSTSAGKVKIGDGIERGDLILNLNDTRIETVDDLMSYMDEYDGCEKLGVTLNRKGRILKVNVSPLIDELSGKYRLGLFVRDNISGVGTTSFVRSDNTFACLGHGIASDDYVVPIVGGSVYDCDIVGVNRGCKGTPGELKGVLKDTANPIGEVYKNTDYGVYGKYYSAAAIPEKYYKMGSRLNVRNGKAKIYTSVNGNAPDFYDIEIIRAMSQTHRADRSMVVRVTDKRLLELTGGIVRGMSGSPIVQNDMIVGAVTHVFVNDPTKGYGLYLDWMY